MCLHYTDTVIVVDDQTRKVITFTMKKMNNRTFTQTVSFEAYQVMGVLFQWIVPIITRAIGIVVFIRRARR